MELKSNVTFHFVQNGYGMEWNATPFCRSLLVSGVRGGKLFFRLGSRLVLCLGKAGAAFRYTNIYLFCYIKTSVAELLVAC